MEHACGKEINIIRVAARLTGLIWWLEHKVFVRNVIRNKLSFTVTAQRREDAIRDHVKDVIKLGNELSRIIGCSHNQNMRLAFLWDLKDNYFFIHMLLIFT